MANHDYRLKTLSFGAVKRIRKLRLNHKKIKGTKQFRNVIKQHGINVKNITNIK